MWKLTYFAVDAAVECARRRIVDAITCVEVRHPVAEASSTVLTGIRVARRRHCRTERADAQERRAFPQHKQTNSNTKSSQRSVHVNFKMTSESAAN